MLNRAELLKLRSTLEEAAFLVSKPSPREAHALIMQALRLLPSLDDSGNIPPTEAPLEKSSQLQTFPKRADAASLSQREVAEVKKVAHRLRLWSARPEQINAQILKTYLQLERAGVSPITEQDLRSAFPASFPFDSNFAQMKIIAERNHGKVFESHGNHVSIWEPVAAYVREFERRVFAIPTKQ